MIGLNLISLNLKYYRIKIDLLSEFYSYSIQDIPFFVKKRIDSLFKILLYL